ncbi:gliding motility-associated C-terminal domain-containing protein [Winogradskyella forsetii]|uniref:T9SS type B sorting domain-containing protein n=1 Tax=Winogradskyella forsetii TaxID=2686077 RepID=UPI0015BFD719|nr:gliding motility-associated C-terminal domain-containing protein [Winogradskyella forsetii]
MKNKYNCISVASITRAIAVALFAILPNLSDAQQAPSIQTGVTFQWSDTQANLNDPATIQSVTIGGLIYNTFVVPTSYEMTRLGPDGHSTNRISENGSTAGGNSNSPNWNSNAISAFQDTNLNHYFTADTNGRNICEDFTAVASTDAQKQTIFYNPAIPSNEDGILAVTERGGNNCFYIEIWGIPAMGGIEQKLGGTFVRNSGDYRNCAFGPPVNGSDYWRSGRCNNNGQTIGIGLFYLSDIAPIDSKITKIEFTGATRDHGDGKFFLLQKYAVDQMGLKCIDSEFNGDLNEFNNVPDNSTYALISGPTPSGQFFEFNQDGTYSYIPVDNFTGEVTFDYRVCLPAPNALVCDTATVTMNFVNLPPNPSFNLLCGSTEDAYTISVDSPLGPEYEYSIDNAATFQASPEFIDVSEGSYTLVVRSAYTDCTSDYLNNPVVIDINLGITVPSELTIEGCDANDITSSNSIFPYSSAQSEDVQSVFATNSNYNANNDFDIQSITYIDEITSTSDCLMSVSRTFTVTDICNNSAEATLDITIENTNAPSLSIPNDIIIECGDDESSANTGVATSNSCGSVRITQSDAETPGACGDTKTIVRTWTATDTCGHATSANQTITVVDTTSPVFNESLPSDITVTADTIPIAAVLTATDNCDDNIVVAFTETENGSYCDNSHTILRNWITEDDCGNSTEHTQTITVNHPVISATVNSTTDINCYGEATGEISINVTGGVQPYTFLWSNSATSQNLTNISAGTYSVTITDANNCTTSINTVINEPTNALDLTITKVDATTAQGCSNGEATANVSGGTAPYTYQWSASANNQTGASATDLPAGNHSVIVTDANDCTINQTIEIACTDDCDTALTVGTTTNVLCFGSATGSTSVSASSALNPTATFTFSWSNSQTDSGVTSSSISDVVAGNYTVSVTLDGSFCDPVVQSITISQPNEALDLSITKVNATSIKGCTDGTATATAFGGTLPYNYEWSASANNQTTATASDLPVGIHSVVVTDGNGCKAVESIEITCTDDCDIALTTGTTTNVLCFGEATGASTVFASSAIDPTATFTFTWSNGQTDSGVTSSSITNVLAGDYTVSVTLDDSVCDAVTETVTISEPTSALSGTITEITNVGCDTENTGSLVAEAIGGTPPYTFSIDNGTTTQSSGQFENLAANTYTVLITDFNGCTYNITLNTTIGIDDNEDPEIAVPPTLNIEGCDASNISSTNAVFPYSASQSSDVKATFVSNADYNASDDYNIFSITYMDSIISTDNCPTIVSRTFTITDNCNNTATATQIITVEDTSNPTITVPADVTIECDEATDPTNTGLATATDDCATPDVSFTDSEVAACGNTKTITRTWTAIDACGNSVSEDQTITIQDTTAPTFTVPANLTIECDVDVTDLTITGDVTDEADNCATNLEAIFTDAVADGDCPSASIITRTWSLTDDCDNTTTLVQTITVQDTTPPTFSVPANITIECDEDVTDLTLTGDVTDESDNCASGLNAIFTDSVVEGNCPSALIIARTWSLTDDCDNNTTFVQTITIQDTTAPTIDDSTLENIDIECGITPDGTLEDWLANNAGATATDNCGAITWTNDYGSDTDIDCDNGAISVTFTATDDCGNTATVSASYSIIDTVAPALTIPADVTIECDEATDPTNTGLASATDDCATPDVSFTDSEVAACGNTKTITRTWTAIDACGNSVSEDQTITIQDTTAPTFTVPANLTIECDVDVTDLTITGDVTDEADNCATNLEAIFTDAIADGDCPSASIITRTWSLTDDCDNTTTLVQTITVQDTTPPTFSVPANITIECDEDATDLTLTGDVTDESDNCASGLNAIFTDSVVEGNCPSALIIARTWSLTDDCDNNTTFVQTITIQDTTAPTIDDSTLENIDIECGITPDGTLEDWLANNAGATATDNCGAITWTNDYGSNTDIDCDNGAISVTFTATDDCGNTATISASYSIIDTVAPALTIPADISIECDEATDPTNTGLATATDDCATPDVSFTDSEVAACGNTKTITRTWTAIDACGNSVSEDQTITVQDTTAPTFSVPTDITVECDQDAADLTITGDVTDEADNCATNLEAIFTDAIADGDCPSASIITRTWSLTDDCDNTTTLVQTITVQDTTPPTFSVPVDITIECDQDATDLTITGDVTDEADNCSTNLEAIFTDSVADGDCPSASIITRTWSLTDDCDNTTTSVQTITVQDTTAPTFSVPADLTVECDVDVSDVTLTGDVTDEADNCATDLEAIYTDSIVEGDCPGSSIITRTWSLTDDCDNTTTSVQTITVQDTTEPTFSVPADITIECDVDISDVTLTGDVTDEADNCTTDLEAIYTDSIVEGDCPGSSIITRTWSLTDDCDNNTTFVQTITVEDTTAPAFNETLPSDIDAECDSVPTAETLTANDNCSAAEVSFEEEITNGLCLGDYIIERTWKATDSCGNVSEHTQFITVQDTTAPALVSSLDDNITVACDGIPEKPSLVFEDSCSNDITVTYNEESTQINDFEAYTITRTWEVEDDCGNAAVFTQNITVEISNVINAEEGFRCVLDIEFDLFDLLSGDFSMDGTWSVLDGDTTLDGSFFDPSTAEVGIYTFLYSITEGPCPKEVEVNVTIDDDCLVLPCSSADNIQISKTVTANGDNVNDYFTVQSIEECGFEIELQIFNRWGAEIYKSNNYQNDWNGEAHSSSIGSSGKVPTGTYFYIINVKNSGLKPFTGPIYVATN